MSATEPVDSHKKINFPRYINPIRTWGGGCFPPGSRFFVNNFGGNKSIQSKLGDFSKI